MKAMRRFIGTLAVVLACAFLYCPGCSDKDDAKRADAAFAALMGEAGRIVAAMPGEAGSLTASQKSELAQALRAVQSALVYKPTDSSALALKARIAALLQGGKTLTLTLATGVTMNLVRIEAGRFTMGSPDTEKYRDKDEGPQHQVTITAPFYMGATELTRGQFAAFVADSGYKTTAEKEGWAYAYDGKSWGKVTGASWRKVGFEQTDTHPVVCVSWDDATAFCAWLKGKTGRSVALPTEAQWEYACRAGTATVFSFGDSAEDLHKHANYCEKSCMLDLSWKDKEHDDGYGFTAPVASYKANPWGLYDMHGNVWEWCADRYAASYANADARDPKGPATGTARVLRGGSWVGAPQFCRAALRVWYSPGFRYFDYGFRVVVPCGPGVD